MQSLTVAPYARRPPARAWVAPVAAALRLGAQTLFLAAGLTVVAAVLQFGRGQWEAADTTQDELWFDAGQSFDRALLRTLTTASVGPEQDVASLAALWAARPPTARPPAVTPSASAAGPWTEAFRRAGSPYRFAMSGAWDVACVLLLADGWVLAAAAVAASARAAAWRTPEQIARWRPALAVGTLGVTTLATLSTAAPLHDPAAGWTDLSRMSLFVALFGGVVTRIAQGSLLAPTASTDFLHHLGLRVAWAPTLRSAVLDAADRLRPHGPMLCAASLFVVVKAQSAHGDVSGAGELILSAIRPGASSVRLHHGALLLCMTLALTWWQAMLLEAARHALAPGRPPAVRG